MRIQDFVTKVLPILVSFATAYFSYSLNREKSDREKDSDIFKRLNDENSRLQADMEKYRELSNAKDKQILKLKKKLLETERKKDEQ